MVRLPQELDGLDGIICYMFPEDENQQARLREVAATCSDSRIVFALPEEPVPLTQALKRFLALSELVEVLPSKTQDQE